MIRVLIADDEALVRAGFRRILEATNEIGVVGDAADGVAAVDAARRLRPDVILMDIRMPRLDGLEATQRVLETSVDQSPRVVILTTFDLDEYVFEALRLGASGFLLKDVSPEQLSDCIRAVAAGDAFLSPSVTRRLIEQFARRPRPPLANAAELESLTAREFEVFTLLARGLSNAEIAGALFVGEGTVKTHVARLLMKLRLRDRLQAAVFAYESGLVQPGVR